MADIVVTWPKSKALGAYLAELARAERGGEEAFFRLSHRPKVHDGDRCYHVHTGLVRGWLLVTKVVEMGEDAPIDQVTRQRFRPGIYVVREPIWHPATLGVQASMRGFRGFRYAPEEWRRFGD